MLRGRSMEACKQAGRQADAGQHELSGEQNPKTFCVHLQRRSKTGPAGRWGVGLSCGCQALLTGNAGASHTNHAILRGVVQDTTFSWLLWRSPNSALGKLGRGGAGQRCLSQSRGGRVNTTRWLRSYCRGGEQAVAPVVTFPPLWKIAWSAPLGASASSSPAMPNKGERAVFIEGRRSRDGRAVHTRAGRRQGDSLRITAISALCKITRHSPSIFQNVIEKRLTQEKDLVSTIIRLLESPSTVIRAKAFLVLLQILTNNKEMLLLSCQARLVMYIERDSQKTTPGKEQQSSNEYLSGCLDLLIFHIVQELPLLLGEILAALANVSGRKHPSTVQAKQLKRCLPMMPVVLHLVTSQVFRPQVVTEEFLCSYGTLLNFIKLIDSGETNLDGAIGQTALEELVKTVLLIFEAIIQHPALLILYYSTIMDYVLPPLIYLIFSQNVEWRLFSLRLLTETTSLLLSHKVITEEKENLNSNNKLLCLIRNSLLPQFELILMEPDPLPAYALKLLISITEYNPAFIGLVEEIHLVPTIFQVILEHQGALLGNTVQSAVAIINYLISYKNVNMALLYEQGLVHHICNLLMETAATCLDADDKNNMKTTNTFIVSLLSIMHRMLTYTANIVRLTLQAQKSGTGGDTETAEDLLLINKSLTDLFGLLIQLLPSQENDIYENASQCLSLLVQLYGGDAMDSMSPEDMDSLAEVLQCKKEVKDQKLLLRIIKRLVTSNEKHCESLRNDGGILVQMLEKLVQASSIHPDKVIASLASEILRKIDY
ncbi:serine/threonine-protein kinase ULK4 [Crotalus adamanteus]|uniref:Serine/threonine-protein kinase ULK4 n=1 Tax=Crotalus adamanteus TaxID=8729 RepID=A0AAW1B311_CROAD